MILSRKGFDGSTGGKPSPILGERLATLQIPRADTGIFYKDLMLNETESYLDLMKDLNINRYSETHLDPDLDSSIKKRPKEWRGLFGQSGVSQGTLYNRGVGPGDIFLFFGWFKEVEKVEGVYRYVPHAPDRHVIFGYLEVDRVIDVNSDEEISKWIRYHPHVEAKESLKDKRNVIYVANRDFSKDIQKRGWGTFLYNEDLVLTKAGASSRTQWKLPACFKGEQKQFTHHIKSWEVRPDGIEMQTSGRGDQEMYVSGHQDVVQWAEYLIMNGKVYS